VAQETALCGNHHCRVQQQQQQHLSLPSAAACLILIKNYFN